MATATALSTLDELNARARILSSKLESIVGESSSAQLVGRVALAAAKDLEADIDEADAFDTDLDAVLAFALHYRNRLARLVDSLSSDA